MSAGKTKLLHSLFPFQREPVENALARKAAILNWDTGLGKTYAAGAIMQEVGGDWLVVCPAGVVSMWEQFRAERGLRFDITPDSQLGKVAVRKRTGIVIDEIHRFKTYDTKRTQNLRPLTRLAEFRLGLTATLIPNDPGDVYEPCSLVYPDVFGSVWRFREAYQAKIPDEHAHSGFVWKGVTPEGGPALARKLSRLVSRVTKADVAHLLTPLRLHVVQEAPGIPAGTGKPFVYLTHNRARAAVLANELWPHYGSAYVLTGALTPKKRHKEIQTWAQDDVPMVATMHCVNEGIDLTAAHTVIFDQLYWRPATIIQAIGRFHRLNQKEPVDIYFVVRPGSIEERIALVLKQKFKAMNQVGNASSTDTAVLNSLGAYMDKSDEEVLAALMNSVPKESTSMSGFSLNDLLDSDSDDDDD